MVMGKMGKSLSSSELDAAFDTMDVDGGGQVANMTLTAAAQTTSQPL